MIEDFIRDIVAYVEAKRDYEDVLNDETARFDGEVSAMDDAWKKITKSADKLEKLLRHHDKPRSLADQFRDLPPEQLQEIAELLWPIMMQLPIKFAWPNYTASEWITATLKLEKGLD